MADIASIAQRLRMVRQAHERFLGLAAADCIVNHTIDLSDAAQTAHPDTAGENPQGSARSMLHWSGAFDDK
jgi:hypothetical protein